ncbi:B-cell receptor CD22-like isoform X2 [Danio rerio]
MVMLIRMAPLPLIFLFAVHMVSSADWVVNYNPLHICALKDSSVIMSCTFKYPTGHQIRKVFWNKDLAKHGEELADLSEDPEYSQRLQYLGDKQQNCTIRLSHVTKKDERMYYFRIITDRTDGKWTGKPGVRLNVTDLQLESPARVTEGDSVRLTCRSSCKLTDTPTFIWYRNSHTLTEGTIGNKLILDPVTREDLGRYRCAVNGHTLTSPDVYLNVKYPPRNVSVSISGSGVIMEGDSVSLSCSTDSNPPAEINWLKGTKHVKHGRNFRISKISSDDSGEYKCSAFSESGDKYSDPVTLDVQYPPKSVSVSISGSAVIVEGDSVTLSCSSDSNPPAQNFSWFKRETSGRSGGIFNIPKISSYDSGEYKCIATNVHGWKYSDPVTLDVQYPPRNVSVSINGSAVIMSGDSVSLMCISDSNPPALSFSWFKENQSSAVGSGQSFSAVQSGRFYCEAHNPHGAQRSDAVTVTVKGHSLILYASIGVGCGAAVVIMMLLICMSRMKKRHNTEKSQMNESRPHHDTSNYYCDNSTDSEYANISMKTFKPHHDTCTDSDDDFTDPVYGNIMISEYSPY